MATDLQTRPAPSAKFETFVDQQLAQVRQRLRSVDVGAAALVLLAGTLAYAVLMAIFDLCVGGGDATWITGTRLVAFGLYLIFLGIGGYVLVTRWLRRINPYYCARQLEETLPDAKNSVINWLDLKEEELPPAIRNSLGQRAAKDLKHADADRVVDPKQTYFLGGVAGALFLVLVVIFAVSPKQFGSLLARAFAPFRDISLANRATITLIRPTGDVSVPPNTAVEFTAQIDGRFPKVNHPQAPTLWYRYGPGEPFVPQALEEDSFEQWTTKLPADVIRNGLWYKITAADAETPTYQVTTKSRPEAKQFHVTYRYRPYLKLPEQTAVFPNEFAVFPEVHGHRGTEATLTIRANQPVRDCLVQLEVDGALKQVPGVLLPDDPSAFRCKFVLEKSGQFRVIFKSEAGEDNADRSAYRIDVLEDRAPGVVLTKPGKDVSLPANGTLSVAGFANDDFGVKNMSLRLRVLEGAQKPNLAAKPYRPGKKFQFDTGAYPTKIDYEDFLALDQLKTDQDQPFPLSKGMILEYWLEATDNSDYPSPTGNVGRSPAFKINILEPQQDDKKQKEDRKQAEDQQKNHEKQQDQQHKKDNQQKNQEAAGKNSGKSPEQQKADDLKNDLDPTAKKLKEELDRQEKEKERAESKGNDPSKADNKSNEGQPPDANQKDSKKGKEPQQAGAKKDDGGKNDGAPPSQAKDKGDDKQQPPNSADNKQAGEPKGAGDQKPQPSAKGQDKDGNAGKQPDPQDAKAGPKNEPKDQPGQGKDQGGKGDMSKSAQAKESNPKDQDPKSKPGGEAKSAQGDKDAPQPQAKNDNKKGPNKNQPAGDKGDAKPGNTDKLAKDKGQSNSKPDATKSKEPPGGDGEGDRKPAQAKGNEEPAKKSVVKDAGPNAKQEQGPAAQAKNQPMNPQAEPKGNAKDAPPDQAQDSATAKNENGQGPPREPTMKDLERLKDQLNNNDPKALQTAKELERNLPEAKDPKMREKAEELLEKAAKMQDAQAREREANSGKEPNSAGPEQNPMDKGQPNTAKKEGNEADPMAKKGSDPQKNKGGENNAAGSQAGGSGPNGQGANENLKPTEANKEFADRAGELQLEDLKKRVNPDVLKRANITEAEWQQFLKDAAAYEQLRNKLRNQPKSELDRIRAQGSQLPGAGPRLVPGQPGVGNPASINQGLPPPELRQAQERFNKQQSQ